jgi:HK97 family phage portal protein
MLSALRHIIARLTRAASPEPRADRPWGRPIAGIPVDEQTALRYGAVFCCVRVIAEAVAVMPWHIMAKTPSGRERLDTHPADWLLHVAPSEEMSAYTWRETMTSWALTHGNGYSEIERDGSLRPIALWPIEPDRVNPVRDARGRLLYEVNNGPTGQTVLQPRDVFHLKGPGWNGLKGYSPIDLARESIGLGLATERFGAAFFGNGATPGGVIEAPETFELSPDAKRIMLEEFDKVHKGANNAHKTAYLDGGMKYKALTVPPETAQFLETRQFQVLEICRWFKVPPHKLYELGRATYNNVEQQQIEFLTETLIPWLTRLEQEADAKLLGPYQRGRMYSKIKPEALLRGDLKSRYDAYAVGKQWGWLSTNDIRALEDMDPIPEGGDIYLIPMNMRDAAEPPPEPAPPPAPALPEPPADDPSDRFLKLLQEWRPPPLPAPNIDVTLPAMSFTLNQEGARFDVQAAPPAPAPNVRVDGAQISIAAPVHVEAAPAPDINIHVEAPPAPPPAQISIDSPITVEAAQPADVTVNVAAPPPAQITVDAPIQIDVAAPDPQPAAVTVNNLQAPPAIEFRPAITVEAAPAPDVFVQLGEQQHDPLPD